MRKPILLASVIAILLWLQPAEAEPGQITGVYAGYSSIEKNYEMLCGYKCDTIYGCRISTLGLSTTVNDGLDITGLISKIVSDLEYTSEDDERVSEMDKGIGLGVLLSGHPTESLTTHFTSLISNHAYMMLLFSFGVGYYHSFAQSQRGIEFSLHLPTFGRMSDGSQYHWGFFDFGKSITVSAGLKW